MTVLFWIVMLYLFIKCLGWVIAPFRREEEYYEPEENNYYTTHIHIHVADSFNNDYSQNKGGTYYGTQSTAKEEENAHQAASGTDYYNSDDYFRKTFGRD
jgi:hypothetical protein